MPKLSYSRVDRAIDAVEAEMKKIGYWDSEPLPDVAYDFHEAFAIDTMAFSQWLQFVFVPRVRQIVKERGEFPSISMVGTQAIREFDGDVNASHLVSLLCKFDDLFGG